MLKTGDFIKDFTLSDQNGRSVGMYELLKNGPVILFFYPKAGTMGCTAEVCSFRDDFSFFKGIGATLVGISKDSVEEQNQFAKAHSLPYTLLSDPLLVAHKIFDLSPLFGFILPRVTFVLLPDHSVGLAFSGLVTPWKHARKAKKFLQALK